MRPGPNPNRIAGVPLLLLGGRKVPALNLAYACAPGYRGTQLMLTATLGADILAGMCLRTCPSCGCRVVGDVSALIG
jgi:hypothetical protein